MSELMRMPLSEGGHVTVEVSENEPGVRRASRSGDKIEAAVDSLQEALQPIRAAAEAALDTFRRANPDEVEIELGVRLNAEAGAVIAKSSIEGHLNVKLTWRRATES
ncbi:CU044_2847 family protein [Sphaerisporangium corydalis]|uniref:CU044_2847 family protein n=1 Tax=Sphaerisporangium corydalis TaxID=1441875 RepID=A0ABV9E659_9ACTN|nr:CU044_2847 family protein [Sphaerisporangium corydalis]